MVAAALRNVRGRLCQRSDPEPIGCSAESNQPPVIPLGADNSRSQIAVFWSAVIAAKCASSKLGHHAPWLIAGFGNIATHFETGTNYFAALSSSSLASTFVRVHAPLAHPGQDHRWA